MSFLDDDISLFFDPNGFGVPVFYLGVNATGNLETPADPIMLGGGPSSIEQQRIEVCVPVSALPRLPIKDDPITVNQVAYRVKGRSLSSDGRVVRLELKK